MSEESVRPTASPQPNRDLLLARALDACIEAERLLRGSAEEVIKGQPAWARAELRRLVDLACSLDAATTAASPSRDFRAAARGRLMQRISRDLDGDALPRIGALPAATHLVAVPSTNGYHRPPPKRSRRWFWRGTACVVAAVVATAATITASASALPGEPLYGIKQAHEELGVRLAADDQARALALLGRADARLDETARLLQLGRADQAAAAAQQFDDAVMRATATYIGNIDDSPAATPASAHLDTRLVQQQEQLQLMLQVAPEPTRADLREALVATERSRALVADPVPVERAPRRPTRDTAMAAPALEQVPTAVPTAEPTAVIAVRHDEVVVPVVRQTDWRNADEDRGRGSTNDEGRPDRDERQDERPVVATAPNAPTVTATDASRGRSGQQGGVSGRDGGDDDERPTGADENGRVPASVPTFVVRGADGDHQPQVAPRGDPSRGTSNGQPGGGTGNRGRDDETPQQPRAAQTDGDSRSGPLSDAPTTTTSTTTAPKSTAEVSSVTAATQDERNGGGRGGEGRAAPTSAASPAQLTRPTVTPTPARAQRGSGADRTATATTRSTSGENRGTSGSDRGGDH